MPELSKACILIADFTIDLLAEQLRKTEKGISVIPILAPFNQVDRVLLDPNLACWDRNPDFAVVWTHPGTVVPSFNRLRQYEKVEIDEILLEVDRFCGLLAKASKRLRAVFVPIWVMPPSERGWGMLDLKAEGGFSESLMHMNLRLIEKLRTTPNLFLLDAQRWIAGTQKRSFNATNWYGAKIPFSKEVFEQAAEDISGAIGGILGYAKKLVVLDLDDTLWGGIVGDIGWENVTLGGHDPIGEALVDFQKALKCLTRRGVLLAIVSKNEETTAFECIENHPEMHLKKKDFVAWRINWEDKAQNISDLVSEVKLGLQSVVFIDDNPVERARVREVFPEIFVPDWPKNKLLYAERLRNFSCFDIPNVTKEDANRTQMYLTELERSRSRESISSLDEWLKTIQLRVKVEELKKVDLKRTVQLLNKTNQMNLSTRRMTEGELKEWIGRGDCIFRTFRVSDRFGDSGLTGIASMRVEGQTARVVDFVLSCRVMGRKVEETMLHVLNSLAQSENLVKLVARYLKTAKNMPCLRFFENSGLECPEGNVFSWDVKNYYPLPEHVTLSE
jgi:FkbH-like protein